jgi:hypothetical protein
MRDGWPQRPLSEIARVERGITWSASQERAVPETGTVAVVRIGNVQRDRIDMRDRLYLAGAGEGERARKSVTPTTILMVGSNGNPERVGNAYLAPVELAGHVYASFLIGVDAGNATATEFIWRWLQSDEMQRHITAATSGSTGLKNIGLTWLRDLRVPQPPLSEQRRIVDLIGAVDDYRDACDREMAATLAAHATARDEWITWEATEPLAAMCSIESVLVDPRDERYAHLRHIGIEAIESRTGRLLATHSAAEDGVISGKFLVVEADVIYSKIRPELRKATFPAIRALCSADAYPLRPALGVDPNFLLEVLLTDRFSEVAIGRSGRTKMPKVNRQELLSIPVPRVPADQQSAIGTRLRELRLHAEAARCARAATDRLRSALLGNLLSGEHEIPASYDRFLNDAA